MNHIDLKPDEYAVRHKGGWRRLSNPKRSGIMFGVAALLLVFVWWTSGGVTSLAALSAMIAFGGGILAADWLRDLY